MTPQRDAAGGRSTSSTVDVATDPATAFVVFTDEIAHWWVPGPINFHDSSRAHGLRIEPGVGGRVVEVYDAPAGDGLELGTITVWEPGARLAWDSSIDDVHIDVRFEPSDRGTLVTVTAIVPPDGTDAGGSAWVRTVPNWLDRWVDGRDDAPRETRRLARLAVGIRYRRPAAAARWLRDVLLLEPTDAHLPDDDPPPDHTWIEFRIGDSVLAVNGRCDGDGATGRPSCTPWVFVDDLDVHYAHVRTSGAHIASEIETHGYRAYAVADPEHNLWTIAEAGPFQRDS